jgi:two-component system response regulator DesR
MRFAAEGADVTEIATALHLAVGTVRNYLSAVVAKLNARNRVDALRIAQESGWLL